MLAPGDLLTAPVHSELIPAPHPARGGETTQTATPAANTEAKKDEGEPRSFLLTLLRCLGAVHT